MPGYQSWDGERQNRIAQSSVPVEIYVPVGDNSAVNILSAYASTSMTSLQTIDGLTDAQIAVSHIIDAANIGLHLGLGIPTGKKELSQESFVAAQQISRDYFNFRAASYGQGFSVSPGLSWAIPLTAKIVGGAGFAWQYHGAYRPIKDMPLEYQPGSEILVTAGLEFAFGLTGTLSLDGVINFYDADMLGDNELYQSGSKVILTAIFEKTQRFDRFRSSVSFRGRGKDKLRTVFSSQLQEEQERSNQNLLQLEALWQKRIGNSLDIGPIGDLRVYDETRDLRAITEAGGGIFGSLRMSPSMSLPVHAKIYRGWVSGGQSFSGIDLMLGLNYRLL